MRAAGDQLGDFGGVVDVGKAEAGAAVGYDVEEVEAAGRGHVPRFDQSPDR